MGDAVRYQVMPPLSPEEYQELHDDIAANGVLVPILEDENGVIIDGHHRSKIAAELGIPCPVESISGKSEAEKRGLAFAMNLKRRHLNREQRRALIAESLKADPQLSNREHARRTGASHPTVNAVRGELESDGALEKFTNARTSDGRSYPLNRPASQPPRPELEPETTPEPDGTPEPATQSIPAPVISPTEVEDLNNPQLDRVDPELEARVKAMSSAPDSGQYINSDSAAARNEKRYQAMSTAREIIARQKDLIALLGEVGGFKGIDGLLDTMGEYTEMAREMSRSQDIDTELDNFTRGQ